MKSFAISYATIGISQYIGANLDFDLGGWTAVQNVASHAMVGGVSAVLQGGKFGHGFVSSLVTASMKGFMNPKTTEFGNAYSRTAIAGVVGGTVSKLTGGKFANGAVTSAMQWWYNAEHQGKVDKLKNEVNKYFSHVDEIGLDEYTATDMPKDIQKALISIMGSPIGDNIRAGYLNTGDKIIIARSFYEESAFQASDNYVYYGDVDIFNTRKITMMQSIDTLLAHEIGHTTVFLSNFANAPSRGTLPNENWTVTNAEDIYRSWKKLPLRVKYEN